MQTTQLKMDRAHRKDATPNATASCNSTAPESFMHRLQELAARHSHLGLSADMAALSLIELWGVYCFLKGIEGGGL